MMVASLLMLCAVYASEVLEDAMVYSEHAGRGEVNAEDVKLAVQSRVSFSFAQPPPREVYTCFLTLLGQGSVLAFFSFLCCF